jgi:hypothetical protein
LWRFSDRWDTSEHEFSILLGGGLSGEGFSADEGGFDAGVTPVGEAGLFLGWFDFVGQAEGGGAIFFFLHAQDGTGGGDVDEDETLVEFEGELAGVHLLHDLFQGDSPVFGGDGWNDPTRHTLLLNDPQYIGRFVCGLENLGLQTYAVHGFRTCAIFGKGLADRYKGFCRTF